MVEYGGTDTSKFTQISQTDRELRLRREMDEAGRQHQSDLQSRSQIFQAAEGLDQRRFQSEQQDKSRELEAARSGLEYKEGKYVESQPAAEERKAKQGIAERKVTVEEREADIKGQQAQQETGLKQAAAVTAAQQAHTAAQRVQIDAAKFARESEEGRQKMITDANSAVTTQLEKNQALKVRLELGDENAIKQTASTLRQQAQYNPDPQVRQMLDDLMAGKQSPQAITRMRDLLEAQNMQIAMQGAAVTGDMDGLVNQSSPVYKTYLDTRQYYSGIMERDIQREFMVARAMGPGYAKDLRLSNMTHRDRMRLVTRAAANDMIQNFPELAAAGGAQYDRGTGAGPARAQQSQQQTKHGNQPQGPTPSGTPMGGRDQESERLQQYGQDPFQRR